MTKLFKAGKITFLMDGQAGSSGKARTSSYLMNKYKGQYQFVCNTFSANAAHWVKLEDGRKFLYKALNSNAYDHESFEKMYIGPGSAFELDTLLQEIEENGLPEHKLGIHPMAVVVQNVDASYEKGVCDFDGGISNHHYGTMKTGSTCSGVGAANARRLLRRPDSVLAKDVPELQKYICDVSDEIMARLLCGQSGFQEIAQGFQLSLMHKDFYPHVTYRNVTTSQALSDMFLPPRAAGPVILNFRTFPIRINSKKFIGDDGAHLTWDDIQGGMEHSVLDGDSGGWYKDQLEISWDDLQRVSGSPESLMELTSKTKLPRRVATFSRKNLLESIKFNDCGEGVYTALNFADYVDYSMRGVRSKELITKKFGEWFDTNFANCGAEFILLGTGPLTEDCIDFIS